MDKLHNQEKLPEIQNLRSLLSTVPKETKAQHEWQLLENTLFVRMDEMKKAQSQKRETLLPFSVRLAPVFPQRILALAAAACLVLMMGFGSFYVAYRSTPKPLAYSRILGIKGEVTYKTHKSAFTGKALFKSQQPPYLFKGQVFETAENATCIVRIDKGSSFILSEKTKLTVHKANTRGIDFYLHSGSILASVSKRKRSQPFTVKTADASCSVIGTIFSVAVSPSQKTTNLTVIKGKVAISGQKNPKTRKLVQSGQTISVENKTLNTPESASDEQMNIHTLSLLRLACEMSTEESIPTGLLDITSIPEGAKIFIGDNFIGRTPLAITYPAGTYELKLTLKDYKIWEDAISLKKLNSAFITAQLHPEIDAAEAVKPIAYRKPAKRIRTRMHTPKKPSQHVQSTPPTKDFGFIMNPAFVEALMQMTIGEYQKALVIFDSLKELPEISITEKIRIMSKISACYKGMGNFENTVKVLTRRYKETAVDVEKSNVLWEIITVKANCLQDYEGAEKDILTYIKHYPDGTWIESAYAKLGELQYINGKYAKAVGTYQYHIDLFKSSDVVEKSVYTLANIMRLDIKDYHMAIKWYSKLLKEYPKSSYLGNALFERADCYEKLNQHAWARRDYITYLRLYPEGHLKTLCSSRLSSQD